MSGATLGDIPPRIGGIKIHRCTVARDEILLEIDMTWASNCILEAIIIPNQVPCQVHMGIKDIFIDGQLRIQLAPLLDDWPLVGGVRLSFLEKPHIGFDFEGIASLIDIPGVYNLVRELIINKVCNLLYLSLLSHNFDKLEYHWDILILSRSRSFVLCQIHCSFHFLRRETKNQQRPFASCHPEYSEYS